MEYLKLDFDTFAKNYARENNISLEQARQIGDTYNAFQDEKQKRVKGNSSKILVNKISFADAKPGGIEVGNKTMLTRNNKLMYFMKDNNKRRFKQNPYPVVPKSEYGLVITGGNERKFIYTNNGDNHGGRSHTMGRYGNPQPLKEVSKILFKRQEIGQDN